LDVFKEGERHSRQKKKEKKSNHRGGEREELRPHQKKKNPPPKNKPREEGKPRAKTLRTQAGRGNRKQKNQINKKR